MRLGKNILIAFTLLFAAYANSSFAQDQCALVLNEAEDRYEQGKLYEIPEMIQHCLDKGFSKEQKIQAYRLLTLTYLFLDYGAEADSAYLQLLKLAPEYAANDRLDPMEMINHHKSFTTKPKYFIGLGKVGINFSFVNVLTDYSMSQSDNGTSNYSSVPGFHVGFGGEMEIHKNLHLAVELLYSHRSVHLKDTHWEFYSTNLDITHQDIELPIMLKYNFGGQKIYPFVSAGVSPSYLIQSSIQNIEGTYTREGEDFSLQPLSQIKTVELKNRFNYSVLFGGGISYKFGLNYLVIETRYNVGMLNVTDPQNRWREDIKVGRDLKFPTGHVDDDFRLNNLSFFVGVVKPLYKPRKIQ